MNLAISPYLTTRLKHIIVSLFRKFGVTLSSVRQRALLDGALSTMLAELVAHQRLKKKYDGPPVACVIFSMDRPLQLAALLSSMREKSGPDVPLYVLYRASKLDFEQGYQSVFAWMADSLIFIHPEKNFAVDLRDVLASITSPSIFFLVDDILFTEDVNLEAFSRFTGEYIPSLRHGKNISYCYAGGVTMKSPQLSLVCDGLVSWDWCAEEHDWSYPLSVDGHIFPTAEIEVIARVLQYRNPNSFEQALQSFRSVFVGRPGLCFAKSRIFNIPANRVQTEYANRSGDISTQVLLAQWLSGHMIDYRAFYGIENPSVHTEYPFTLIARPSSRPIH